jgi:hypothetical protein
MEEALAAGTVLGGAVSCELGERRDEGEEAACGGARYLRARTREASGELLAVHREEGDVGEQPGCLGEVRGGRKCVLAHAGTVQERGDENELGAWRRQCVVLGAKVGLVGRSSEPAGLVQHGLFLYIEKTNSPEDDDFEETLKRVQQVYFFKTTCRLQYA